MLGLDGKAGTLKPGAQADFVLFDPKGSFMFDIGKIRSASRNSPFIGRRLHGVVHSTYVAGTKVYDGLEERR